MIAPNTDLVFSVVPRSDLAEVLRHDPPETAIPLKSQLLPHLYGKDVLVLWYVNMRRPAVIGVNAEDRDELFNWATTFQRDLSPLSAWCHILTLEEIGHITRNPRLEADLTGLEAAWAGAAIAEAMILSRRSYDIISLAACLATETYALGRAAALYGRRSAVVDTTDRLEKARDRLRPATDRWRAATSLPVEVLSRLLPEAKPFYAPIPDLLVRVCRSLHREHTEPRLSAALIRDLTDVAPQLAVIRMIDVESAEQRVRILRDIAVWIEAAKNPETKSLQAFAAGYAISRVGGAGRDLRLAEGFGSAYPEVLMWAAILGGLGENIYWSDAFGGIGRLVARELSRSLDLFDPPTADISVDELVVVSGPEKSTLKFRSASRSTAAISLRPGVVVHLPIGEEERLSREEHNRAPALQSLRDLGITNRQTAALAEQLFPHIRQMLEKAGFQPARSDKRRTKSPQLPLK